MSTSEQAPPTAEPETAASPEPGDESPAAEASAETPTGEGHAPEREASPEELRVENARLRAALEKEQEQSLRLQAEVENVRRRGQRDLENAHKYGTERLVAELLPVIDSMELGLGAAKQENAALESVVEGTELTLKMLLAALAKFEVQPIDPLDAPFDPELHQAMSMQAVAGTESGTVVQVVQKGYSLSGRLVRPAMVIVAS